MGNKKATIRKQTPHTTIAKATVATNSDNSTLNLLTSLLLITYGYVTVIASNWTAFDSDASKFCTPTILNLVVVAVVFLIKGFRERTQVLFDFFDNKTGIAYSIVMIFALLFLIKALDIEEAILHCSRIFVTFTAAWVVSTLVIYSRKNLAPLVVAMTLLLLCDFLITTGGIKDITGGISGDYNIRGDYSNKSILVSAMFIKISSATRLFYFNKKTLYRLLGGIGMLADTLAIFFMGTRIFYLAIILTVAILVIYGIIDYFIRKKRETRGKVLIHVGLVVLASEILTFV